MLSFVIPARNRPHELDETLRLLGSRRVNADRREEVIVLDNASDPPLEIPRELPNGTPVYSDRIPINEGAAARNRGVERARGEWIVMLDDDSVPIAGDLAELAARQPDDVAAVGGEILLPDGSREAGGVPEVIIGCGCLIRRQAFLEAGGYDPDFGYYAEEYDLCARFILSNMRITHSRGVRFLHRKVTSGRSMDLILGRLVRNNGWTIHRYSPTHLRESLISSMIQRYRTIARREDALAGFEKGLAELERTIESQPTRTMSEAQWDRFSGEAAVREHLSEFLRKEGVERARLFAPGKGAEIITRVIEESGGEINDNASRGIIGTISPGPMLDAMDADPDAVPPWQLEDQPAD